VAAPFAGKGPTAGELSRRLGADIERVAEAVLGELRRTGSELIGRGRDGGKWIIETRGAKRGLALCAAQPEKSGDPLTMIAHAAHGGDMRAAYRWALAWLGEAHRAATPPPTAPAARPPVSPDKARKAALARFLAGTPWQGTPAEAYLRGRALAPALDGIGRALRFTPGTWHSAAAPSMPAMLAAIIEPTSRKFMAVHCTYLQPEGAGWRKARLDPPKKVFAPYAGGVIPLTRGASGRPLATAPEDDACLIAEGIENALAAHFLRPELRAFAAVAVGNLAAIALPESMASVDLVCDRDGENDAVMRARNRATDRWLGEGRAVQLLRPPAGYQDFADWLAAVTKGDAA
jgi:hypothetical protein